jgi:predicted nucleotidyltransferase
VALRRGLERRRHLVGLEPGRTLLDLVALGREWGALLGRRADLTTPRALPLLAYQIRGARVVGNTR